MARALSAPEFHNDDSEAQQGEWQVLRNELVTLLDQVESQYQRVSVPQGKYEGLARRVEDLRQQVSEPASGNRHREALRSVKRAVDRFNAEPGEADMAPATSNPRDVLQSAIKEIRTRQQVPSFREIDSRPAGNAALEDLARSITRLTGRLEQIETDLKATRDQGGNVREIGEQVSQLTHVVELLAGAVGETGQVKRLEAQIAELAVMMDAAGKPDISDVTRRLDDLAQTVDRLADIQVQHFGRDAKEGPTRAAALTDGMQAIEQTVRNVYDRIDAIERNLAMPSAEVERLTDVLANFTETMHDQNVQPASLLPLVEAMNDRLSGFEGRDGAIGGLKSEIGSLRAAVVETMAPRFSALEERIDALQAAIGDSGSADLGISQIEAQIRQLVARMDQTGEQLANLSKLYTRDERSAPPDMEALASLVARKTSEAVSQARPTAEAGGALSSEGLDAIEERVSRLFDSRKPADDFSGMQNGIRKVDERLERLEAALSRMTADRAVAPQLREPVREPAARPAVRIPGGSLNDDMPHNPSEDRPLVDKGFADLTPVRAALEEVARGSSRPVPSSDRRSASADIIAKLAGKPQAEPAAPVIAPELPAPVAAAAPRLDPASIPRPPRPVSAFDTITRDDFAPQPDAPAAPAPDNDEISVDAPSTSSRNTFIEAARRAAQRQNQTAADTSANSLIGRAFSRFQPGNPVADDSVPAGEPVADKPSRKDKKEKKLKAAKEKLIVPPGRSVAEEAIDEEPANESFLSRYRRPILLTAALIAVSLMTLNLVIQRMGSSHTAAPPPATDTIAAPAPTSVDAAPPAEPGVPATPDTSVIETPAEQPPVAGSPTPPAVDTVSMATPAGDLTLPAPGDGIDDTTVGAINPAAAMNFTAPGETAAMPPDLRISAVSPEDFKAEPLASPVKVELPPEALGPLELRQSAANGDARSQFEIGAIYTEGRAVPQDLKEAAKWYERSAAQGFVPAEYRLGSLYEAGKGVDKDLEQARLWYQRAAEAGNRMSMHNLAALYAGGNLGKQDFSSAAEWFEQAAMRGLTDSQFNLGMLYARGLGVPQNLETSYKWFSLAAKSGDADAAKARDDVAKSLTADKVAAVTAEVDAWKAAAIDLPANFAPIGTWSDHFDAGQAISDKAVVSKVQAALARLGYDIGTPDGLAGPKTADAIKSFEHSTGMNETGAVNPRLLAVLGSQPV